MKIGEKCEGSIYCNFKKIYMPKEDKLHIRKIYLDALRIIAVFLVIFNHLNGYLMYQISSGWKVWFYMFLTMITRVNVPLFLMISGSLLLGKEESISVILKKRLIRIASVLLIFSTLLYVVAAQENFSISDWFLKISSNSIEGSYWYLYAYIGMLLMLPYLRRIVKGFCDKDFIYIIVLHFLIYAIVPIVNYVMFFSRGESYSLYLNIPIMTLNVIFFPLLGYYLDRILPVEKINKRMLGIAFLAALVGIFVSSMFTYYSGVRVGFSQDYVQLFDYLTTIFVFIFVKYLFVNKKMCAGRPLLENVICKIGQLTFGMYLLDPLWKNLFYLKFEAVMQPLMPIVIFSGIWCILSMFVSGIVTYGLKKIWIIRNLL